MNWLIIGLITAVGVAFAWNDKEEDEQIPEKLEKKIPEKLKPKTEKKRGRPRKEKIITPPEPVKEDKADA